MPSVTVPSAETADGVRRISDAFRRFDTSGTGLLCLADFTSAVLDDAPSVWLPESKPKMNLALAGRRLTAVARLGNMRILPSADASEGGDGGASTIAAAPEAASSGPDGLLSPKPVRKAASGKAVVKAESKGVTKNKLRKAGKLVMIAAPSKASKVQPSSAD